MCRPLVDVWCTKDSFEGKLFREKVREITLVGLCVLRRVISGGGS